MKYSRSFVKAAETKNITPEKLAQSIRRLLSRKGCRNTSPIFDEHLLKEISAA